jgi:cytochrome c-type biogenesis protein CcsB
VSVHLASISNDLFGVTVVVYSLAMLAYAAEFAFVRRPAPLVAGVPAQAAVPARVLVGAGGSDVEEPPAPVVEASSRTPHPWAERIGGIAVGLTVCGWLVHLAEVVTRGVAAGRVPGGNMYEFSSAVALMAVGAFLVLLTRQPVRWLGVFVLLPVVLYLGLAGTVLYVGAGPLVPALNSYWIKIHVVAAITATGTFMVGGVTTVLHLVRRRHDNQVAAGRRPQWAGLAARMPSAQSLDRTTYRLIAFAFPVWTFAVIAGAIWAESAWGRYWGWDPKETWSFITWVLYAAYLHSRSTVAWRKAAPMVALLAFVGMLVNYYVINTVVAGLHSYAF